MLRSQHSGSSRLFTVQHTDTNQQLRTSTSRVNAGARYSGFASLANAIVTAGRTRSGRGAVSGRALAFQGSFNNRAAVSSAGGSPPKGSLFSGGGGARPVINRTVSFGGGALPSRDSQGFLGLRTLVARTDMQQWQAHGHLRAKGKSLNGTGAGAHSYLPSAQDVDHMGSPSVVAGASGGRHSDGVAGMRPRKTLSVGAASSRSWVPNSFGDMAACVSPKPGAGTNAHALGLVTAAAAAVVEQRGLVLQTHARM
ncbi:hypothetical protein FOA52_005395 [Chlamydomonas sp. UWO 241]|nr:hypothetical protein FOA52_005395 [Chlamydomonas sp. UWO 241]